MAKDLVSTGTHVSTHKCTYILFVVSTVHSNIPTTSQSDQKLSKNQPPVQDATIVIKLPAKRLASNLLQVKASNRELPTIVTPILTAQHQLRHFPLGTAAVTNVRPDRAGEQAAPLECLTPPDQAAPRSPRLTGSYEGIAMAKPPLVTEITVRLPKSKSLKRKGALEPTQDDEKTKDLTDPVQKTPTTRNEGAQTG